MGINMGGDGYSYGMSGLQMNTLKEITLQGWTSSLELPMAKNYINSLLGLWRKPKYHATAVRTATYTEDLQRSGPVLKRAVEGHPTLHDYIFETELKTNTSMRPIHQVCLDMEHVYLPMAYRLAKNTASRAISVPSLRTLWSATLRQPSARSWKRQPRQ